MFDRIDLYHPFICNICLADFSIITLDVTSLTLIQPYDLCTCCMCYFAESPWPLALLNMCGVAIDFYISQRIRRAWLSNHLDMNWI